ncbi:MAG TPA: VWA domain-containing protein [Bryobacteraceae bacterium]|nr:VWA domain-containing protein [Bryobacteraceae bacterium]
MSFEHAWVLALLALPLGWMLYEWRRTRRSLALILKTLTIVAIILAVSEPKLSIPETKMAVAVLVDTSASLSEQDLARASQLAETLERSRGRHWVRILPFARSVRNAATGEQKDGWHFNYTAGEAGQATDLEAAVREAIASLPSGLIPRLLLISDGKENAGSVTRATWQAQSLGIPIDTIALAGKPQPTLRLESVSLPTVAFTGERFPIDLTVSSPANVSGSVQLSAEGKLLGADNVKLERGTNQIRVHARITAAGALSLSGVMHAGELGEVRFDRAMTLRRPKVLYISQDPEGTEAHLMQTLSAAEFDVDRTGDPMHGTLSDYQLVLLNNIDLEALPASRKDELESFVKEGGGLLVVGGERNVYNEAKTTEDALDRTLPAKLAPPRSPEGTAVVLIIDKSSSMEGRKIELARLAAIGVVDNLRPVDLVGVLIFDNSFQWAVPVRRAEDRAMIKRLIAGIVPDGGTQIAPALAEAYRRILPARATFKHIVLLTDGISEEGDSLDLSKEAAAQHVTISTVGLGQDVNRAYLEKVANLADGKAYFLNEPAGLEQILLKDVMEHTGSTAVEKSLRAVVEKNVEILDGVGIESAPALKGYVRFVAKPSADTILRVDPKDPLLVRWQYGLGRAVVFTSDAKSRWAADWVGWKGFDRLWTNVFRDLLPHSEAGEAKVDYDSASGDLVVNYQLGRDMNAPDKLPAIYIFGPGGFRHPLPVAEVADRSYRGRIHIGQLQGLFRIRPLEESRAFPEVGYYRQEQELLDYGSNPFLLRSIAEFTGGRFNPQPRQVFDAAGRSQPSSLRLWPELLVLALLLNLAELIMRKGRAVLDSLLSRPGEAAA